ncbi:hypothetical protein GCM10018789_06180 [Streptomyces werraensis]|nr:hypothetical protein GCM10018789_06180 [Streptomyces werraensis]
MIDDGSGHEPLPVTLREAGRGPDSEHQGGPGDLVRGHPCPHGGPADKRGGDGIDQENGPPGVSLFLREAADFGE